MSTYVRYMLVAFLTNGLGAFGLRILAGAGLGHVSEQQYLSLWYVAGALVAAVPFLRLRRGAFRREWLLGGAMAGCSLFGQLGMALALSNGLPGFVVFPVATGGGLLFVLGVGVAGFRERVHWVGYLGIATGTLALVLLALP
jgi:multidrug transporter EmrE-like cation transporter